MQPKMIDGTFGDPMPFDQAVMDEMLEDENVEHVEVFKPTADEIRLRKQLAKISQEAKARKIRKQKNKQSRKSRRRN